MPHDFEFGGSFLGQDLGYLPDDSHGLWKDIGGTRIEKDPIGGNFPIGDQCTAQVLASLVYPEVGDQYPFPIFFLVHPIDLRSQIFYFWRFDQEFGEVIDLVLIEPNSIPVTV